MNSAFTIPRLLIDQRILYKKHNFEDNFSAKIGVSGWMKANMAAASDQQRILGRVTGKRRLR